MITLDGSTGEGGGQILRTALTLSMITGQPFRIDNIRANRSKPGLMRQHLVAVQAAAEVCGAEAIGTRVGATTLEFWPGKIMGGDYKFAIGTAGSCTLVLQTLLPALLFADAPSAIHISGGTHNPMAPPLQFLQRAYGRVMAGMGAAIGFELHRFGFYPAGGGAVTATLQPCARLRPFELMTRGDARAAYAESFIAGIPLGVAERELECVRRGTNWGDEQLITRILSGDEGPGNALLITLEFDNVTEVFSAFGERAAPADTVAKTALRAMRAYLASHAAVDEHLADQLMIPMALAGSGRFTTVRVAQHAATNAEVIGKFLPANIVFSEQDGHATCLLT